MMGIRNAYCSLVLQVWSNCGIVQDTTNWTAFCDYWVVPFRRGMFVFLHLPSIHTHNCTIPLDLSQSYHVTVSWITSVLFHIVWKSSMLVFCVDILKVQRPLPHLISSFFFFGMCNANQAGSLSPNTVENSGVYTCIYIRKESVLYFPE